MDVPMCPGQVSSGPYCVDLQRLGFSFSQGPRQKFDHDYRNSLQDSLWFTSWENSEGSPVKSKLVFFLLWKKQENKMIGRISPNMGGKLLWIWKETQHYLLYTGQNSIHKTRSLWYSVRVWTGSVWGFPDLTERRSLYLFPNNHADFTFSPGTVFAYIWELVLAFWKTTCHCQFDTQVFLSRILCWGVSQKWKH